MRVPEVLFLVEGVARGSGHIPSLVDHEILPSKLLERGKDSGIGLELVFIDREAVGVPTVPAHGRSGGEGLGVAEERRKEQSSNGCR